MGCSPWGHKESDPTERLHFKHPFYSTLRKKAPDKSLVSLFETGEEQDSGLRSEVEFTVRSKN